MSGQPTPAQQRLINEMAASRGKVIGVISMVDYYLTHLLLRCRQKFPEYASDLKVVSRRQSARLEILRAIISKPGPLNRYSEKLAQVLTGFENNKDMRDFLAHGYTMAHRVEGKLTGYSFSMYEWPKGEADPRSIEQVFSVEQFRTAAFQTLKYGKSVYEMIKTIYDDLSLEREDDPSQPPGTR